MANVLNLDSLVVNFLCFDQPIVIKVIAIILINGCSTAVNRKAEFFITTPTPELLKAEKPNGETKYNIKPINNCVCVPINPKIAIFLSLAVNSFLPTKPAIAFTTAITNNTRAK